MGINSASEKKFQDQLALLCYFFLITVISFYIIIIECDYKLQTINGKTTFDIILFFRFRRPV